MLKKIKIIIATFITAASVASVAVVPSAVAASAFQQDACSGISQVGSGQGCNTGSDTKISGAIKTAINLLSLVVGVAAVIAIIINGLRFITAQGDASSVASARMGLIYAIVGLAVAALAQFIVHYVLGKV